MGKNTHEIRKKTLNDFSQKDYCTLMDSLMKRYPTNTVEEEMNIINEIISLSTVRMLKLKKDNKGEVKWRKP